MFLAERVFHIVVLRKLLIRNGVNQENILNISSCKKCTEKGNLKSKTINGVPSVNLPVIYVWNA